MWPMPATMERPGHRGQTRTQHVAAAMHVDEQAVPVLGWNVCRGENVTLTPSIVDGSIATCRRSAIGWTLAVEVTLGFVTSRPVVGRGGGVFQPEDSGCAMTAWSWGLTVVGTWMDFAGTSRWASGRGRLGSVRMRRVRAGGLPWSKRWRGVDVSCVCLRALQGPAREAEQFHHIAPACSIHRCAVRRHRRSTASGREDRGDVGHAGVVGAAPFERGLRSDCAAEAGSMRAFGAVGEGEACLTGETGAAEEDADLGVRKSSLDTRSSMRRRG